MVFNLFDSACVFQPWKCILSCIAFLSLAKTLGQFETGISPSSTGSFGLQQHPISQNKYKYLMIKIKILLFSHKIIKQRARIGMETQSSRESPDSSIPIIRCCSKTISKYGGTIFWSFEHSTSNNFRQLIMSIDISKQGKLFIRFIQFIIKMNAIVKIGNLHYLKVLEQLLFSKVEVRQEKTSLVKLSFFNFIELTIQIYQQFVKNSKQDSLQVFLLNFFMEKHPSSFELYRHMYGFISMWKKYVECHQQARILLSILSTQRSGKECVRLFLKIRKAILKNIHSKIMQDIVLCHEDIIAISHTIFSPEMKSFVGKKIHELFISLKRKSTNSDKMNGAVVCEFFMNCAQKFERQELDNVKAYYQKNPEQVRDKVENKQQERKVKRTFKPLDMQAIQQYNEELHPKKPTYLQSDIQNEEQIYKFHQNNTKDKAPVSNFILNNICKNHIQKSNDPLQTAKQIVNKKYSNSWQRLLKTNQEMKEKLLRNHQQNL